MNQVAGVKRNWRGSSSSVVSPDADKRKKKPRNTSESDDDDEAQVSVIEPPLRSVLGGAAFASSVISGRVALKTRKKYAAVIKEITRYCKGHFQGAINDRGELKLPMAYNHLEKFFGDKFKEREDQTVLAYSTLTTYTAALKFYYSEKSIAFGHEAEEFLKKFYEGYTRLIANKRNQGIMSNFEGKLPISYLIYVELAKRSLHVAEFRSVFSSFVHCFMLLCWNMCARPCSVADLRTGHLSWQNDSLVIDLSKQKSDQSGERIVPKHLYANPDNPEVCVILALALQMFGVSFNPDNADKTLIFLGTPLDNFSKWLHTALQTIPQLGNDANCYGTHSFRKGIAQYCSGFIGGPNVIALYLRAGWSLGHVQERYITESDGGDQLLGRIAAGLNFNGGSKFAVLPPHCKHNDLLSENDLRDVCPTYDDHPPSFKACIPYLLATLAYHYNWWTAKDSNGNFINVSEHHPIHLSRVATSPILQRVKADLADYCITGKCLATGMIATGIPNHIDNMREIEKLRLENMQLRDDLHDKLDSIQLDLQNGLPIRVSETVLANCNVEGAQQISRVEFQALFDSFRNDVLQSVSSNINIHMANDNNANLNTIASNSDSPYDNWHWGGKMNLPVPMEWSFPKGSTKCICDLFITGSPWESKRIRPYRLIRCHLLQRKDQSLFSRAESVFCRIQSVAREKNFFSGTITELVNLPLHQWDIVFRNTFTYLISLINERGIKH